MASMKSLLELSKMQQLQMIPKIEPIRLKNEKLIYPQENASKVKPNQRILMITTNKKVAYSMVSASGHLEDDEGLIIFADGSLYKGSIKKGEICGFGCLTNEEKMFSYDGQWNHGAPDGYGTENISNNIYEGNFKKGQKEGKGVVRYADGSIFEGAFKSNQINGYGKLTLGSSTWKGFWRNGSLEGEGTQAIRHPSCFSNQCSHQRNSVSLEKHSKPKCIQSLYTGSFVHGEREGFGRFRWDNNREYEGNFKRGQLHGEGILRFGNKVFRGVWEQGTDIQMKEVKNSHSSVIQLKRV